jgi:hypothetical protein
VCVCVRVYACVFEGAHGLALRENAPAQPLRRGAEVVEAAAGGIGGCGGGGVGGGGSCVAPLAV